MTSTPPDRGPRLTRAELADAVYEGRLSPAEAARIDPSLAPLIGLTGMSAEEAERRIDLSADEALDQDDVDGMELGA